MEDEPSASCQLSLSAYHFTVFHRPSLLMDVDAQHVVLAQHIVILIHGLHGHINDLECTASAIREYYGSDVAVLTPTVNHGRTHSGIDAQSQRVYEFLIDQMRSYPKAKYISIIGQSLGGLIARRLAYLLHRNGIIPNVLQPIGFVTVATPHLGSRHHGRIIFGLPLMDFGCFVARICAGTTGQELFLLDGEDPLLVQMADDDHLAALRLFRHRSAYACARHDMSVAFPTAAICRFNPYRDDRFNGNEALLKEVEIVDQGENDLDELEELVRSRLDTLEWRRYVYVPVRPIIGHLDILVTDPSRIQFGGIVIGDIVKHLAI